MSVPAIVNEGDDSIPQVIDHATAALTSARSAGELLEARDLASFAYDAAKRAARLAKAMREARAGPFHHLDVKAVAQGAECFIKIKEWINAR